MTEFARELLVASGVYVLLLLVMGWLGRRAKREDSLSDHYLAGRNLGFLVLLLTLFATQYSGNSLSGFPGKTYRAGLAYVMSTTFMVAIVAGTPHSGRSRNAAAGGAITAPSVETA